MEETALVRVVPCSVKDCGGTAVPTAKEGRFYFHQDRPWLYIPLPANLLIPRCTTCRVDVLTEVEQEQVTTFLNDSYREHQGLIETIVAEFRARKAKEAAAR